MRKPFVAGLPVTGELFTGRKKEIEKLIKLIQAGQPTAIVSPRKLGKTSLIRVVETRLKNIIPVYIDCWDIDSQKELAKTIIKKTLDSYSTVTKKKDLKNRVKLFFSEKFKNMLDSIEKVSGSVKDIFTIFIEFKDRSIDIKELLIDAINFPEKFAEEKNVRIAMIFDEFQSLNEIDGHLLRTIRANTQLHKRISYIILGSQQSTIEYLIAYPRSPFFKMFEFVRLGNLEEKDVESFVKERFRKFGFKITDETIEFVKEKTDNNPFYVQKLCLKAYNTAEKKSIDKNTMIKAYDEMIEELWPSFEDVWSASFSNAPLQREILKLMSIHGLMTAKDIHEKEEGISVQSANQALRQLTQKGFLKKMKRGNYTFMDKVFEEFIRRRFSG